MSRPLITVLMALYNGGEYLKQTVKSVLGQTYAHFEFLIVNDCSTDRSLEIIASFNDDRIKIHHNHKNLGQTPSLNIGVKLAKGDYFARIDGDDLALPQWLQTQVEATERYPDYSVISSYAFAIDEKNQIKKIYKPPLDREDIILRSLITPPIHHVGSILKKKDILDVGGYDERYIYAADYDLWERLVRKNFKITTTPKVLVAIREHAHSVSRSEHGRQDLVEVKEIAGRNISNFIKGRFSNEEVDLFCRANYAEGNLTADEFNQAVAVTKRIYTNLIPTFKIEDLKIRRWTTARCRTIYLKRIFFLIIRRDYKATREVSLKGIKEFGIVSIFSILWAGSFLGGALIFVPGIYSRVLQQKARFQSDNLTLGCFNNE